MTLRVAVINNIIIPFFTKYPLRGTKHLDEEHLDGIIEGDQESGSLIALDNNIDQNLYNIKTPGPAHIVAGPGSVIFKNFNTKRFNQK